MSINKFAGVAITTSSKIMGVTGASKFMGLTVAAPPAPTLDAYAGLVAWYKTPISGATNGAAISTWYDSKGSYNWSGGAYGPTYSTATTLNGFETVTATHTNYNYLSTGGPSSSSFPVTLVAVVKHTGTVNSGYGNFILGSGGGASGITFGLQYGTDYLSSDVFNTANIGTGNVAVTANVWHVLVAVITSSTYAFWIDGVTAGSGSHSRTIGGSPTFQFSQNDSQSTLGGSYVELGIYNTNRTADVAAITSGLQSKYAI